MTTEEHQAQLEAKRSRNAVADDTVRVGFGGVLLMSPQKVLQQRSAALRVAVAGVCS